MKQIKTYFIFMAVTFFLILTGKTAAFADLIYEPQDSFYEDHSSQCTYINRFYTADGPDGKVTLWESPDSRKKVEELDNGIELEILYSYTDNQGTDWGYCENGEISGWVPMTYLHLVYDGISFQEDHASEITTEEGAVVLPESGNVRFWEYPGSEKQYEETCRAGEEPEYQQIYTDEEGRVWGCCSYYMGIKSYWICLDAPDASPENLYPDDLPAAETEAENENDTEVTESRQNSEMNTENASDQEKEIVPDNSAEKKIAGICAVFVILIMAVTGVLLAGMKRQ